jgi:hypothetical protein
LPRSWPNSRTFPGLNTYPAEYTGGPTIKNPDGSIPHETKGVYVYNNVIRSNKGAASFLTFPSLQYSYKPEVYEAFLNKEYKGDSNTYLNPAGAAMFVLAKSEYGNLNQWKERLRAEFTDHTGDQEVHSRWDAYLPNPPAAPGSLNAAVPAEGQITLTWTDRSDNEAGFIVQRKVNNAAYRTVDTVAADVNTVCRPRPEPRHQLHLPGVQLQRRRQLLQRQQRGGNRGGQQSPAGRLAQRRRRRGIGHRQRRLPQRRSTSSTRRGSTSTGSPTSSTSCTSRSTATGKSWRGSLPSPTPIPT